jgi:hypothetical protein
LGAANFSVQMMDSSGLSEIVTTSCTITVNPTLPTVNPVVTGALGDNGWYVSSTVISWTVTGFPIPTRNGCATESVPNTKGKTYKCSASNSVGSATESVTIKVDTVRPEVTISTPAKGARYALKSIEYASYGCSDKTSGVALCLGPVADGASIDTSSKGTKHFTVTSKDNAGNAEIKTVSYTVE